MTQVLITEFCDELQIQSLICYWQSDYCVEKQNKNYSKIVDIMGVTGQAMLFLQQSCHSWQSLEIMVEVSTGIGELRYLDPPCRLTVTFGAPTQKQQVFVFEDPLSNQNVTNI